MYIENNIKWHLKDSVTLSIKIKPPKKDSAIYKEETVADNSEDITETKEKESIIVNNNVINDTADDEDEFLMKKIYLEVDDNIPYLGTLITFLVKKGFTIKPFVYGKKYSETDVVLLKEGSSAPHAKTFYISDDKKTLWTFLVKEFPELKQ